MNIKLNPNSKIYIVAPANTATGGPESLHQLAYHLGNDLNFKTFMYYLPTNTKNPIHPEYIKYNVPFTNKIEDNEFNILIVPEVVKRIEFTKKFIKIRKVIWWLSIDNFYISYLLKNNMFFNMEHKINMFFKVILGKALFNAEPLIYKKLKKEKLKKEFDNFFKNIDYHLVNSFYGFTFLNNTNISKRKIYYLSGYLNEDFLKTKTDLSKKENIVAYNPNKGFKFTKKIIDSANDIKFVPLVNMTREQVIKTLQRAKVYIDFGNHPGKERMPREAAVLGCCVITGKRGSAAIFEDVPIPDKYKFEDKKENIPKIIEKIDDCFENFEERYKDFNYYRKVIKNEPVKFVKDLKAIFNI